MWDVLSIFDLFLLQKKYFCDSLLIEIFNYYWNSIKPKKYSLFYITIAVLSNKSVYSSLYSSFDLNFVVVGIIWSCLISSCHHHLSCLYVCVSGWFDLLDNQWLNTWSNNQYNFFTFQRDFLLLIKIFLEGEIDHISFDQRIIFLQTSHNFYHISVCNIFIWVI